MPVGSVTDSRLGYGWRGCIGGQVHYPAQARMQRGRRGARWPQPGGQPPQPWGPHPTGSGLRSHPQPRVHALCKRCKHCVKEEEREKLGLTSSAASPPASCSCRRSPPAGTARQSPAAAVAGSGAPWWVAATYAENNPSRCGCLAHPLARRPSISAPLHLAEAPLHYLARPSNPHVSTQSNSHSCHHHPRHPPPPGPHTFHNRNPSPCHTATAPSQNRKPAHHPLRPTP